MGAPQYPSYEHRSNAASGADNGRSALSVGRFTVIVWLDMSLVRIPILITLLATTSLRAESPAEQRVLEAIKAPDVAVIHLWTLWRSNCHTELINAGSIKI